MEIVQTAIQNIESDSVNRNNTASATPHQPNCTDSRHRLITCALMCVLVFALHELLQIYRAQQHPPPASASATTAAAPIQKVLIHCSHHHPTCSCVMQAVNTFTRAFHQAFKMYLPLFAIPPLIRFLLRAKTRAGLTLYKATNMLVLKPLLSAVRSASFIGGYSSAIIAALCFVRRFYSQETRSMYVLVGAFAGLPILIEKPARYAELNLYCLARAAETLYNTVAEHIGRTSLKFAETPLLDVMVFSWSCAVLFWAMQHQQQMVRASMRSVLSNLLGVN
eukprot:c11854_g1_i2.p1 GENE.c11854_g1_i2~~c11854_g1_i2.p1  ORF type:complete len:279 (+),score=81.21 c11854_g1_i2:182-1018(+)